MTNKLLNVDERFDHIDKRFDKVDERFDHIDKRFDNSDSKQKQMVDLMKEVICQLAKSY